jgi:hypothetical protein
VRGGKDRSILPSNTMINYSGRGGSGVFTFSSLSQLNHPDHLPPPLQYPFILLPSVVLLPPSTSLLHPPASILPPSASLLPSYASLLSSSKFFLPSSASLLPSSASLLPPSASLLPPSASLHPSSASLHPSSVSLRPSYPRAVYEYIPAFISSSLLILTSPSFLTFYHCLPFFLMLSFPLDLSSLSFSLCLSVSCPFFYYVFRLLSSSPITLSLLFSLLLLYPVFLVPSSASKAAFILLLISTFHLCFPFFSLSTSFFFRPFFSFYLLLLSTLCLFLILQSRPPSMYSM